VLDPFNCVRRIVAEMATHWVAAEAIVEVGQTSCSSHAPRSRKAKVLNAAAMTYVAVFITSLWLPCS